MGFIDKLWFRKKVTTKVAGTTVEFNVSWLAKNLEAAKIWLNQQIVADCTRFIPFRSGALRSSVVFTDGVDGDDIQWNTPYAHYMYEGEIWVNPKTMKSGYIGKDGRWHGWKGSKIPSGRPIEYHTEGTGDHWVEKAQEAYGQSWQNGVRKIASRGK